MWSRGEYTPIFRVGGRGNQQVIDLFVSRINKKNRKINTDNVEGIVNTLGFPLYKKNVDFSYNLFPPNEI